MLRRMEHVGPATTTRETGVDGGCGFRYRSAACAWGRDPDRIVPVFAEMLSPGRQQVLDVGCGEGRNALWLAGAGITVHAVDIDAEALGRADQKWSTAGRIRPECADIRTLPLEPGTYNGVLVCNVLQWLPG